MDASPAPTKAASPDLCTLTLLAIRDGGELELGVPGTEYRLHLACEGDPSRLRPSAAARRVQGTIHGKALKLSKALGGGKFIEPLWGHPRIVQGTVLAADAAGNRLLVDLAVPAWLTLEAGQSTAEFPRGTLVNMYLASGMTFRPAT
jgi:hypothetical protein